MIDKSTIKRVAIEAGAKDVGFMTVFSKTAFVCPEVVPDPGKVYKFTLESLEHYTRAIEQLARKEQREADARICEGMTELARTTKASRLMARECMAAIRASGKENGNE